MTKTYQEHRIMQDRLRAERTERMARKHDAQWLSKRIKASDDKWIQAKLAELKADRK